MNTAEDTSVADAPDTSAPAAPIERSPLDKALSAPRGRPNMTGTLPTAFDHPTPAMLPAQDLHPAQVTSLPGYDAELSPVPVKAAVEALQALHDVTAQVINARNELKGSEQLTPAAQVIAVSDMLHKLGTSATQRLDNATRSVRSALAADEKVLAQPMTEGARGPFASELRAVLRAMPVADRMKAINDAIAGGDSTLVGAVLGAPPMLTSIQQGTVNALALQWNQARNPEVVQRVALLRSTLAKLDAAGPSYIRNIDAVVGSHHYTVERLRTAKAHVTKVLGAVVPA